tara:strand:- start:37 stop:1059 length:1023 start_codon:yes stop_codon:yes gene_type:complete
MHNVINNIIDDSYEKLLLDEMPVTIEYGIVKDYSELLSNSINQLRESDKKRVIVIKVGEMFDVIMVNKITKELQKNFPDKEFILLVDDYRELDLDFKFIKSMAGWCIVLHHAKDRDGEDMINFKNIDNHHRNKLFLSRNNKGKIHRTEWVKFLEDNNLKEKGYVSEGWNGIFLEHLNGDFIETVETFEQIGYNYWNQRYPSRDDFSLMNFYNDSFCEVVLSSEYDIKASPYGAFDSEKEWRPFLCCVIPQIVIFKNYDDYLRAEGFDLFDDVLDTSFYKTDNLNRKFEIIKSNLEIIENDLIVDSRFRDDIWLRLKSNQDRLFDGWENYFYKKIDEFKNV